MAKAKRHTFRTLNNLADPANLKDDEMSVAENVDIRDDSSLSLRRGRTLALSGTQHSFWATSDESTALCVEGSTLKQFWANETTTSLLSLSNNDPMAFVEVNNVIVFSNGADIGFVQDGEAQLLSSPTEQFKIATAAGKYLAFYNGRLFILADDGLYYTDPYTIDQMDERNCLIPLLGEPKMLAVTDGGVWLGKGNRTIWLGGGNPEEFTFRDFNDSIVPGTMVAVDSSNKKGFNASGRYAVWASDRGIVLGANDGVPRVLTEEFLAVEQASSGAAVLREQDGMIHYVVALQDTETELNKFTPASITVDSQTTGG